MSEEQVLPDYNIHDIREWWQDIDSCLKAGTSAGPKTLEAARAGFEVLRMIFGDSLPVLLLRKSDIRTRLMEEELERLNHNISDRMMMQIWRNAESATEHYDPLGSAVEQWSEAHTPEPVELENLLDDRYRDGAVRTINSAVEIWLDARHKVQLNGRIYYDPIRDLFIVHTIHEDEMAVDRKVAILCYLPEQIEEPEQEEVSS